MSSRSFQGKEKSTNAQSSRKYFPPSIGFRGNRSDEINLDVHGYSKLAENGNTAKIQGLTTDETPDHPPSIYKANVSKEDLEAWPGEIRGQADLLPSYPSEVAASRRDVFERETVSERWL